MRVGARDVDRAFPGELLVIKVEDLIVEALEGAFGDRDEAHWQVQAGQPRGGLDQVREVLEVRLDLVAVTDAAHGGDQAQGLIRLDHESYDGTGRLIRLCLFSWVLPAGSTATGGAGWIRPAGRTAAGRRATRAGTPPSRATARSSRCQAPQPSPARAPARRSALLWRCRRAGIFRTVGG